MTRKGLAKGYVIIGALVGPIWMLSSLGFGEVLAVLAGILSSVIAGDAVTEPNEWELRERGWTRR